MNILRALADPKVFGPSFRGATWNAWRAFLAALFALPMSDDQLALYRRCTGRTTPPLRPFGEAWLCIGRRGGKSFVLAVIAVFLAVFKDWRPFLGPGEVGTVMVIAADRKQARVIMRYVLGLLQTVPMLKRQIQSTTRDSIELRNSINIEIHACSFRSTRGYTIVAALCDEAAYWPTDESSAEPDIEVINAIRPGMATIPGAMLLVASSPHARRGALWKAHRKHFGKDGDAVLVWQAATRTMNPSVPQSYIDQHMADDPARASAEYLAQFRTDIESFVLREAVEACICGSVYERPPQPGITYVGFVDPSGGSADSFTLTIGHNEVARQTIVTDAIREVRPPFSPEAVIKEFAALLKTYRLSSVVGDRYASIWPVEMFSKAGIYYEQSAKPKSDLYAALLPLINSCRIELLDHPRCVMQLCGLERRTARGGRDIIDHPPGGHDDVINAVAGAAAEAIGPYGSFDTSGRWIDGPDLDSDEDDNAEWRRARFAAYVLSGGNWTF